MPPTTLLIATSASDKISQQLCNACIHFVRVSSTYLWTFLHLLCDTYPYYVVVLKQTAPTWALQTSRWWSSCKPNHMPKVGPVLSNASSHQCRCTQSEKIANWYGSRQERLTPSMGDSAKARGRARERLAWREQHQRKPKIRIWPEPPFRSWSGGAAGFLVSWDTHPIVVFQYLRVYFWA